MNSDAVEVVAGLVRDAEAIVPCGTCGGDTYNWDGVADQRAYAMATNAWKSGRFRGMRREDVMDLVKSTLNDTNDCCCP